MPKPLLLRYSLVWPRKQINVIFRLSFRYQRIHLIKRRLIAAATVLLAGFAAFEIVRRIPAPPQRSMIVPAIIASSTQPDALGIAVSPTEWHADLGTVAASKTFKVLFLITDPGDQDLQIRGVHVSCPCTAVPKPPDVIPKNGSTVIEVFVKSPDRPLAFESTAEITTSDGQLPPLLLRIQGRVH
jgi:hypothetical protein